MCERLVRVRQPQERGVGKNRFPCGMAHPTRSGGWAPQAQEAAIRNHSNRNAAHGVDAIFRIVFLSAPSRLITRWIRSVTVRCFLRLRRPPVLRPDGPPRSLVYPVYLGI